MAARRMASATTLPPNSGALNPESPPWNLPIGVRTADRITAVSTAHLQTTIFNYSGKNHTRKFGSALRATAAFFDQPASLCAEVKESGRSGVRHSILLPRTVFVRGNAAPPAF